MGFIDTLASRFTQKQQVINKEPSFSVTQYVSNNPFLSLIEPEFNYFEQYILYTYKAIDYISSKVASSEILLLDAKENVLENDVDFSDLKRFNPYMNLWEARKLREVHLMLTGAAFWYIDRKPKLNKRVEYYPLEPTKVKIKTNAVGLPAFYEYTDADGRIVQLPLEDLIYFRRVNPKNWFEGLSPVKAMGFWTNAYAQGAQYNMNKLGNNINVDKFLVFEDMGREERERVELLLRNKYGGARNAGRTGVVAKEPKVVDVSSTQKDLDYVAGMQMLRQDILAGFGIPEALFFPSATNSNTKEARTLFQTDTVLPIMEQESAALNEQLIPKVFKGVSQRHFSFASVVDSDLDALVSHATQLVNAGVFTRNQALEYIGEETVPDGDVYLNSVTSTSQPDTQTEGNSDVEDLDKRLKDLATKLDELMDEKEEREFVTKSLQMADDQEGIFYAAAEPLFQKQAKDTVDYIKKKDYPTVRGIFKKDDQVAVTEAVFKEVYAKVIANTNETGNTEVKQKLFRVNDANFASYRAKSISAEALEEVTDRLKYFATEVTEVTQAALRKMVVDGMKDGFDKSQFIDQVTKLFNGYIDGAGNIEILQAAGVYSPSITTNKDFDVSFVGGERYTDMYNNILLKFDAGEISSKQKGDLLRALRGVMNPADPLAKTIDRQLDELGVNKDVGISYGRATTIARTEATFARNLGFDDLYKDNPFVKGKRWKSLQDKDTRPNHAKAHNRVVKIGENFNIGNYEMRFPGDGKYGAPASEIVNCRCRITAQV